MKIKCPICGEIYTESVLYCRKCHFNELNKIFCSEQNKNRWENLIVIPAKEQYNACDKNRLRKSVQSKGNPKKLMDLFGNNLYLYTMGGYLSKNKITKLKFDQESLKFMDDIGKKLQRVSGLKKAATMESVESSTYKVNMEAIETLLNNIRRNVENLKYLDIKEIDFSDMENIHVMSDFDILQQEIRNKKEQMQNQIIHNDYEEVKSVIKINFNQFGFESESEVDRIDTVTEEGKKVIDQIIRWIESREENK